MLFRSVSQSRYDTFVMEIRLSQQEVSEEKIDELLKDTGFEELEKKITD